MTESQGAAVAWNFLGLGSSVPTKADASRSTSASCTTVGAVPCTAVSLCYLAQPATPPHNGHTVAVHVMCK